VMAIGVFIRGRDMGSAVEDMQRRVAKDVRLAPGARLVWGGEFENQQRAMARLRIVIPLALLITFFLLFSAFNSIWTALLILLHAPFALIGGFWLLFVLGQAMSVATAVGFIALAGVSAEFGVIMLLYLKQAWERRLAEGEGANKETLLGAIREGAVQRVRPKAMTVAVILAGLLPIMFGDGSGSEIMQRIAAPMIGGMITAPLLSMLVIPVVYGLLRRRNLPAPGANGERND